MPFLAERRRCRPARGKRALSKTEPEFMLLAKVSSAHREIVALKRFKAIMKKYEGKLNFAGSDE